MFLSHCAQPPLLMTGPGNAGSHLDRVILIFMEGHYQADAFIALRIPNQQGSSEALDCQNFGFLERLRRVEASADASYLSLEKLMDPRFSNPQ